MNRGTDRWEHDGRPGGEEGRRLYEEAADSNATLVLDEIEAVFPLRAFRTITRLCDLLPLVIVEWRDRQQFVS